MNRMDNNLLLLIEKMSGIHDKNEPVGSESLSWKAYQIAREINDLSLVPNLFSFIDASSNNKQKKQAYQLLLFILMNTNDNSLANQLVTQLKKEDQNDDCLYTLLIGLWESKTALENQIDDVIFYIDDQRELVRNAAIRLLSLFKNNCDRAENALIEIIQNPYDDYDLKYAVETLSSIGSEKSIVPLQRAKKETDNYEIQQLISEVIKKLK